MRDRFGLEVTTDSGPALALLDRALVELMEYRVSAMATVEAALAADPRLALARCLKGCLLRSQATRTLAPAIQSELALAEAERPRLGAREGLHLDALAAWARNDLATATRLWRAIVGAWPRDLLAVRLLHHQGFWMGRRDLMREAVALALPAWEEGREGYGFLLGMLAFALEEAGELDRAERLARRAVELNPEDLWSIHAVAHVLETRDRPREGAAWLARPIEAWSDRTSMRGHLFWHAALFELERGRGWAALGLYDRAVLPRGRPTCVDLHNAASLLARLELAGLDVGGRWDGLAEQAASWTEDHVYPLTDLHAALVLARTGRPEADALLASLERLADRPREAAHDHAAAVAGPILVPLVRAVTAFYRGEPGRAVDLLLELGPVPSAAGGSNAQRDLLAQLLLEAALAAGRPELARALAAERVRARPHDAVGRRQLARALAALAERARRAAPPPSGSAVPGPRPAVPGLPMALARLAVPA